MPSRATLIADALRPKKAPDTPDVFSAPKQSWADYVGTSPATGYEGMPAPQTEGMPEHDPNGAVSRIANALATMPSVQGIRDAVTAPVDAYQGKFDPTSDEGIGRALGMAGMAMTGGVAGTGAGGVALGSGPIRAYHGSPQTNLTELKPSERGPFGPGVYLSPAEQVAQRYARGGKVYEKDIDSGAIFQGTKPRDSSINPYDTWREQSAKLVEAAEPEMKQAVAELASRMDPSDGYPFYVRLAQLYKSDAGAQGLIKRAGYKGISGYVDGPEIAHFDPLQVGIKAYHGSPHDFDKFDLSKIGTGEGAQAYGHGLYFAESEGVARNYRDALSGKAMDDRTPLAAAQRAVALSGDNGIDGALKILEGNLKSSRITAEKVPHLASRVPEYEEAIALLKGDKVPPPGRMYEVAIHADPERFLDWDKPLSRQPHAADVAARVADATKRGILSPQKALQADGGTGADLYQSMRSTAPSRALGYDNWSTSGPSQALRDAGIPGIKYLDQGSRGGRVGLPAGPYQDVIKHWMTEAGNDPAKAISLMEAHGQAIGRPSEMAEPIKTLREWSGPTSNYVLFDDKIVEILRKYGVGSIAALPPAVQMAIQLHQDQTQAEPQEPTFAGKASKMINDLQRKLRGHEPPATPLGMGIRG